MIDKNFGKVIGELWGVTILNENVSILKDFKLNAGVDDLVLIDLNNNIVASTLEKEKAEYLVNQNNNKNTYISKNKQFIISKRDLMQYDKYKLKVVFIISNERYNNISKKFVSKISLTVISLLVFGILLYIFLKLKFINKLLDLKYFIQGKLQNKEVVYDTSSIQELDTIAFEFERLFFEFSTVSREFRTNYTR